MFGSEDPTSALVVHRASECLHHHIRGPRKVAFGHAVPEQLVAVDVPIGLDAGA
jgi:hypothetical protein